MGLREEGTAFDCLASTWERKRSASASSRHCATCVKRRVSSRCMRCKTSGSVEAPPPPASAPERRKEGARFCRDRLSRLSEEVGCWGPHAQRRPRLATHQTPGETQELPLRFFLRSPAKKPANSKGPERRLDTLRSRRRLEVATCFEASAAFSASSICPLASAHRSTRARLSVSCSDEFSLP